MEIHKMAKDFPPLTTEEKTHLESSIKKLGVLVPVFVYKGKIIDGVHRMKIASRLGKPIKKVVVDGEDPWSFVEALNLARRNMDQTQVSSIYESAKLRHKELADAEAAFVQKEREKLEKTGKTPPARKSQPRYARAIIGRELGVDPTALGRVQTAIRGVTDQEALKRLGDMAAGKTKPRDYKTKPTPSKPNLSAKIFKICKAFREMLQEDLKLSSMSPEAIPFTIRELEDIQKRVESALKKLRRRT